MATARVLATQQARDTAKQMLASSGPLKDQIGKVIQQGNTLKDPNQWDGNLAEKCRGEWDADEKQLQTASRKLKELEKRAWDVPEPSTNATSR